MCAELIESEWQAFQGHKSHNYIRFYCAGVGINGVGNCAGLGINGSIRHYYRLAYMYMYLLMTLL